MKVLRKLDSSSRVLIILALLGILTSLIALFSTMSPDADGSNGPPLANIVIHHSDTRLKRSGNIHWYQVNKEVHCFEDDMVFTGDESFATIEFPNGDKVQLLPNSLVSISRGRLSLESGAIEVDLSSGSQLSIASFGQVVNPQGNSRFQLVHRSSEQKVVSLEGEAPTFKVTQPVTTKDLRIISPSEGKIVPAFPGSSLKLSWDYEGVQDIFTLKLNGKSLEVDDNNYTLDVAELPAGQVQWAVKSSRGESAESSFFVIKDLEIKLVHPEKSQTFKTRDEKKNIDFSWSAPLSEQKRILVSNDPEFRQIVHDGLIDSGPMQLALKAGAYYWKVGYSAEGKHWSPVSSFNIIKELAPNLSVRPFPKTLDFTLNKSYPILIEATHKMKKMHLHLSSNGKTKRFFVSKNKVNLRNLEDGQYQLKVSGETNEGEKVTSEAYSFSVKNSTPIAPPKIKKNKVKLFVNVINHVLNFIFPSAHAAGPQEVPFDWDGPDSESYELIIAKKATGEVVLKKIVKGSHFNFDVPGPGTYSWKVRQKLKNGWGPFSQEAVVFVEDKITTIEQPLMRSAVVEGGEATFTWHEPFPDFKYYLEIYTRKTKVPILSVPVKGEKTTIKLPRRSEKLYWRVSAVSTYANKSKNRKKFLIPKDSGKVKDDFTFRAMAYQRKSTYSQKADDVILNSINKDLDLVGQGFEASAEWAPSLWNNRYLLQSGFRMHSGSKADEEISETEFSGAIGYLLKNNKSTTHHLFLGMSYTVSNLSLQNSKGSYTNSFVYFKHRVLKPVKEKFLLELNTSLHQPMQFDLIPPSLVIKPVINWNMSGNWWLSAFAQYERIRANPEYNESGLQGNIEISNDALSMGLGLTFIY